MPCNSDHMRPTSREEYNQKTAKLLVYVLRCTGWTVGEIREGTDPHKNLMRDSLDIYCPRDYTAQLCEEVKKLTAEQMEDIVYNGKDKTARKLADWWDDHKKADREREEMERKAKEYDLNIAIQTLQKMGYDVELTRRTK